MSVSALRKSAGFFSLTVLALSLPVVSSAGTVYYLQTGHTGSQTFINTDNATDWYAPNLGSPSGSTPTYNGAQLDALHTTFAWDLGGANILIKEGPSTSDTITFALWQGGLTGQEVAWVSWTAAQVCDYKVNTVGDAGAAQSSGKVKTGLPETNEADAWMGHGEILSKANRTAGKERYLTGSQYAWPSFVLRRTISDVILITIARGSQT